MDMKKDRILNLRRTIFYFTCQGESDKSSKLLIKQGQIDRPMAEVCKKRVIRMAYINRSGSFHLDVANNNTMVTTPGWVGFAEYSRILSSFFISHGLTPTWQNANGDRGRFIEETGMWTGVKAMVRSTCLGGFDQ